MRSATENDDEGCIEALLVGPAQMNMGASPVLTLEALRAGSRFRSQVQVWIKDDEIGVTAIVQIRKAHFKSGPGNLRNPSRTFYGILDAATWRPALLALVFRLLAHKEWP